MYNAADFANETKLGAGCRRVVYAYDETSVLKVDIEVYNNYISSRGEIFVWNMVKDTEDARHFAAILDYTEDGWIRMERVSNVGDYRLYSMTEFDELCKVASKYNVTDMHAGNVGQRADGSWCIIDYGAHLPTYEKRSERNVQPITPQNPDRPCSCSLCVRKEVDSYEGDSLYPLPF